MSNITTISSTPLSPVYALTPSDAAKLADLYLPVRLRNFFLSIHPVVQHWLYSHSSEPTEFFSLVDQEWARYGHQHRNVRGSNDWHWLPTPVEYKSEIPPNIKLPPPP